jgi:signal peptidase I
MRNSRIEKRYLPPQAKELGAEHVFVYTGNSMLPTFRPGTLLYVRPAAHDLTPGDVVVYHDSQLGGYVVHRVVSGAQGGLVTRGDANATVDTQRVAYGQVIGQVMHAEQGGQLREVRGGRAGLRLARLRWLGRGVWGRLAVSLAVPYRWLRTSTWARRGLKWLLRPHFTVVRLQTPNGVLVKVLHRGRVVGRAAAGGRLVCRKPYDLLIAEGDGLVDLPKTISPSE